MPATKDPFKPLKEWYPRKKFGGLTFKFYVSRTHKFDAQRDKHNLRKLGYNVRIWFKHGRYMVFYRKPSWPK